MINWNSLFFRPLCEDDLPRVMDIEPRAYTFHWSEGIFRDCLEQGYAMPALLLDEKLVGYAVYSMAACEAHLLNITIEPEYMGRGLGKSLLDYVIDDCREKGNMCLFLEVRVSNDVAYGLYRSKGFKELGIRQNYYPSHFNSREDGRVMGLELVPGGL